MDYPFQLSVVVPCYNVERHLELSLWCLEQQWDDDKSMEVVFVNDGSSDGTLEMLQSYCRKHPDNTVIIDKVENCGVAQARNDAMRVARGRWITFFDPDDAISAGAYQAMSNDYLDDNVDILSFDSNRVYDVDMLPLPHYRGRVVWEGDGKDFFKKFDTSVPWTFIYRHELLERLGVSFPDLSFLEGGLFNLGVFLNDGIRVKRVDCKPYYYHIRTSSLSSVDTMGEDHGKVDEVMSVIEYMEQSKSRQHDAQIMRAISAKQAVVARQLMPIFLRSDQVELSTVSSIRQQLKSWHVYPYKAFAGGVKQMMYSLLFHFPRLIGITRPLMYKGKRR